ncbi:MAG: hypothetical protein Q9168_003374 [Polycauliona sp. 1 TL-2023]
MADQSTYYLDSSEAKGEVSRLGIAEAIAAWQVADDSRSVVGVDITPPTNEFGLENLTLVTADVEKPWQSSPALNGPYDLISLRVLVSGIGDRQSLYQHCFEHLNAGGWIEIPDITIGTISDVIDWRDEFSPLMRWYQCYRRGAALHGIDGFANRSRMQCLRDAGFTQISEGFFTCYLDAAAVQKSKDKNCLPW